MGRLASTIAKQLLRGNRVTVVRCEGINMSGAFIRRKLIHLAFLRKKTLTNPKKGPFHNRSPSKLFERVVRGMVPYKTTRGATAMRRLRCFEGMPAPYDRKPRVVCPRALRVLRLQPDRAYCTIGRLAHEIGWKYKDIVEKLEVKRKERSSKYHEKKVRLGKTLTEAKKEVDTNAVKLLGQSNADILLKYGYNTV